MKSALFLTIILSLCSMAWGQEIRRIDARIGEWNIQIDYTRLDDLPDGKEPYTRVRISSDHYGNHASMQTPFRAFFALWDHLDSISKEEPSQQPIKLPANRDGAILMEGKNYYKLIMADETGMLVRLWLDIFNQSWDWNLADFREEDKDLMGWFGYQLRNAPFPPDGKFEHGTIPKKMAQQDGAGQPATRPKSKSESSQKPQPESEGRSR